MSRTALLGTVLNEIAGSQTRKPRAQVLVYNPHRTSIGAIANGTNQEPPVDLSAFTESVSLNWNVGWENGDDPSIPSAAFAMRRAPNPGVNLRKGFLEDGVIVQVRVGDDRVRQGDWEPIFTGIFRGTPGNDTGSRADRSEGFTATAYGREQQFVEMPPITTEAKPAGTDLGEIVQQIARHHMGLTQGEILVGTLGVVTLHETNQIVDLNPLQALWECMFPAGKKPMFDSRGRLVAVDFHLDKPATRVYSEGNFPIRSLRAAPNDVEVNNSVVLTGQDHNLTRIIQDAQELLEVMATVGFFESEYDERHYYSPDRSQRAQDTYLVTRTRIEWSSAIWRELDEFSGKLQIDTRHLRNARAIIFATWLATQLAVIAMDLLMDSGVSGNTPVPSSTGVSTLAILRSILSIVSQVAMAGLLWAMQYIGRGRYAIHGKPFEYAYQELKSRVQLVGLLPEQVREAAFRNDFISTMDALDAAALERLRREMVKNQLYDIEMMDDPLLEVDDVIETLEADRFYILSIQREIRRGGPSNMTVRAWRVRGDHFRKATEIDDVPVAVGGYGLNYGLNYGEGL